MSTLGHGRCNQKCGKSAEACNQNKFSYEGFHNAATKPESGRGGNNYFHFFKAHSRNPGWMTE